MWEEKKGDIQWSCPANQHSQLSLKELDGTKSAFLIGWIEGKSNEYLGMSINKTENVSPVRGFVTDCIEIE